MRKWCIALTFLFPELLGCSIRHALSVILSSDDSTEPDLDAKPMPYIPPGETHQINTRRNPRVNHVVPPTAIDNECEDEDPLCESEGA